MLEQTYQAVHSEHLSKSNDKRFVVVHTETGEIVDDAQGYGYKSKPKAYKAYAYKLKQQRTQQNQRQMGRRFHGKRLD